MLSFSNDADILRFEPILFGQLHLPGQVLTNGTEGELSGTTFTKTEGNFESAQVSTGGVIYLQSSDAILDGAYEIVSVDSETQLTISVLRADTESNPIAPPQGSNISYRISTFSPQAKEALFQLTQYLGIRPGASNSVYGIEDITDTSVLRQASVFAIISGVYAMLTSKVDESETLWKKSLYYQSLFQKARERCRICLDKGLDGVSERTNYGASINLTRD